VGRSVGKSAPGCPGKAERGKRRYRITFRRVLAMHLSDTGAGFVKRVRVVLGATSSFPRMRTGLEDL